MPKQADLIETLNIYTIRSPYIEIEISRDTYELTSNYIRTIQDYQMIEDEFSNTSSKILKVFNTSRIQDNFVEKYWQAFQLLVVSIAKKYNYTLEQFCYDNPIQGMIFKYQPNSQRILKEL